LLPNCIIIHVYKKNLDKYKIDTIISKQILIHLNEFFEKLLKTYSSIKKQERLIQKERLKHIKIIEMIIMSKLRLDIDIYI